MHFVFHYRFFFLLREFSTVAVAIYSVSQCKGFAAHVAMLWSSAEFKRIEWLSKERCTSPSLCISSTLFLPGHDRATCSKSCNKWLNSIYSTLSYTERYHKGFHNHLDYVINVLPIALTRVHRLFLDRGLETSVCSRNNRALLQVGSFAKWLSIFVNH